VLDLIGIFLPRTPFMLPVHTDAVTFRIAGIFKVTSLSAFDRERDDKYLKSSF
jgi:hypothetical protein